jgi:molecular chaperone GrpE
MSNGKPDTEHNEAQSAEPAENADGGAEARRGAEAGEAEDVAARATRLEAEVAELRDQLLRALAESENQRRRSQREREDAVRYAAAPMLRDLLPVADNLQRALASVPAETAERDDTLRTLLEGVQLTQRELESVFERHGIVRLDPMGELLNPHHHEAMFEVPDPQTPSGTIVQVVEPGYLLHDRLLRPARVGVAKGGPPPGPGPGPGGGPGSGDGGAKAAANDDQAGEASDGADSAEDADSRA